MNKPYSSTYLNFFMNNPHICMLISSNGDIIDINNKGKEFLNYRIVDYMGKSISNIFPAQERAGVVEKISNIEKTGFIGHSQVEIKSNDGIERKVNWSIIPAQNNDYISCFKEILKGQEAFNTENIQSISEVGSWKYTIKNKIIEWSDITYKLHGLSKSDFELTIENYLNIIVPEDRDNFLNEFSHPITPSKRLSKIIYRIIHGVTGKRVWVMLNVLEYQISDERVCGATGILQNIDSIHKLNRNFDKYFQIVNQSTIPMVICNLDGKIDFVNNATERLYNYKASELIGKYPTVYNSGKKTYSDELGYSDNDYNLIFKGLWDAITNSDIGYWEGEVLNKTKDGKLLLVNLYISTVRDDSGEKMAYIASNVNISEHRKEEDLRRLDTYKAIAALAEQRDNETGKHMNRIGEFCYLIAQKLKMSQKYCRDIKVFAPLHDIGKVGIPDSILLAERKLTKEEFEIIKTHTTIGFDILKNKPSLEMAAEIAYAHQEKYDGSGYPRGIAGKAIPLSARICALADVYDALRSKRPYKQAFSEQETIKIITESIGTHFDPEIVDILLLVRDEINNLFEELYDEN